MTDGAFRRTGGWTPGHVTTRGSDGLLHNFSTPVTACKGKNIYCVALLLFVMYGVTWGCTKITEVNLSVFLFTDCFMKMISLQSSGQISDLVHFMTIKANLSFF